MGPCGPASAQRSLARRALPMGWAIGGAGGPALPLAAGRPSTFFCQWPGTGIIELAPDLASALASGQCPGFWPVSRHPELLSEHGRPLCTAAA